MAYLNFNAIFEFLGQFTIKMHIIYQKGDDDNFEIEHKTCKYLVKGAVPPNSPTEFCSSCVFWYVELTFSRCDNSYWCAMVVWLCLQCVGFSHIRPTITLHSEQ